MSGNRSLADAKVGDRIAFAEESQRYTIQARGKRYLVCTRPFALQRTVFYTVVDLVEQVRGTENLVFDFGAETVEQCEEMLARLEGRAKTPRTEVSQRNRIPLRIESLEPAVLQ